MGFRNRSEFSDLERQLDAGRARLDRGVERELVSQIRAAGRARHGGFRLALAGLSTTAVFAILAASGGVSYAVSAAKNAVGTSTTTTQTSSGTQYGEGGCVEYVNPHGAVIPPAGQTSPGTNPNSGQNPDGFYQVSSSDGSMVYVIDQGSGTVFGPYASGTVVKYTQAPGKTASTLKIGSTNGQAGAVTVHITGTGDMGVQSVNGGPLSICLVPRPPK
jgi:hypothetical protein